MYNKEKTIRRAILSILAQNVPGIEIFVVDDGSTDSSAEQVRAVPDSRITLIQQANAGPGSARNAGAARARADLLTFLDGDDEWKPGFLAAGLAALERHPEAVAYTCSFDAGPFAHRVKDKVSLIAPNSALLPPPDSKAGASYMKIALDGLHSSSTIVRRSSFQTAGGFYERDRCLWGEDSYLWGQILFMGPVYWDSTARIFFHVEDSELGFAVRYRGRERPLATFGFDILKTIAPAHQAAFFILAQKTASDDADNLAESGHFFKCLALRRDFRLMSPKTLLGDVRRYFRYLKRNALANH